jgi:hypothetical protein
MPRDVALNLVVTRSSQNQIVILPPIPQINTAVDLVCRYYFGFGQNIYLTPDGTAT